MNEDPLKRVELLLGEAGVVRLREACVTIAGLGAVGAFATEALVRSGVGRIRLVDFDTIHPSNLNRLLFAMHSTIGKPKIEVAAACQVEMCDLFINESSVEQVVGVPSDVIIDAIDSVNPKAMLLAAAVHADVPIISAMGAATRVEPGSVQVADISQTRNCPLARFMRKRLRKRGIQQGVRCVYSMETKRTRDAGGTTDEALKEGWDMELGRVRAPLGSLCPVPGIFGLTCASEAMRIILGDLWPGG